MKSKQKIVFLVILSLCLAMVFVSCNRKAKRVGILAALPQELSEIESKITDKQIRQLGEDKFILGKIGTVPIVATLSGMGKVNATIAAQRLISKFNASAILFTGVAGGINPSLEIGDIVLGVQSFQHDVGFLGDSFIRHSPGILPEIGIGKDGPFIEENLVNDWPPLGEKEGFIVSIIEFVKSKPVSFMDVVVNGNNYLPKIKTGVIATGDQFIAQEAKKEELRGLGADLVEMEGGAVAQVAKRNSVPCLIIRSISDKAGSHAQLDFGSFFSKVAKNNTVIIISMLSDNKYANYINTLLK